jgi:tight adherence protein B
MVDGTSAALGLVLLLVTLALALCGVAQLAKGRAERATLRRRTALEVVERRAARPTNRVEAWLRRHGAGRALEQQLRSAGLSWRVIDFAGVVLVAAAGSAVVLSLLLPVWLAAPGVVVAVRGCWAYLGLRRRRRRDEFVAQLPELARVISNAAGAGLSMLKAIEMARDELGEPAASELEVVAQEQRLGQSLDGALRHLQQRVPSRDVGVLVSTLVIQQRAGGDLAYALREMAEALEQRKEAQREVRTVMSGAVFTGYLVAGIGLGTILLVNALDPDVLNRLVATTIGRLALLASAALYTVGLLLVRQITRIEA